LALCTFVARQAYLDANPVVPWDDLRYIFGEIMYGGHITDAWDRRTCNTYLQVSNSILSLSLGLLKKHE
jgi:dynein heavy chain, axonemal